MISRWFDTVRRHPSAVLLAAQLLYVALVISRVVGLTLARERAGQGSSPRAVHAAFMIRAYLPISLFASVPNGRDPQTTR